MDKIKKRCIIVVDQTKGDDNKMSDKTRDAGRNARSAYQREWRRKNKDKVKSYQERYWERRAIREEMTREEENTDGRKQKVSNH